MNQASSVSKILILSSSETDRGIEINDDFVKRLNVRLPEDCRVEWSNYHNIGLEITSGKLKAFLIKNDRELSSFKTVYFKSYYRYMEQASFIVEFLRANKLPFTGKELLDYVPAHKLSQMARLAGAGIQVPPTVYLPLEHYLGHYQVVISKLGEPFIFKVIDGKSGNENYLVKNRGQLETILKANPGRQFVAQTFIANKSDFRVLVLGGEVSLVIERRRKDDSTHLNNTSQGASAHLIPLGSFDKSLQALAARAAKLMKRDLAGVDLMLEEGTGQPYVLEVNPSPQMASGAFEPEKEKVLADYLKDMAA